VVGHTNSYLVCSNRAVGHSNMNTALSELEDFRRTENGRVIQGASHTSRILNHKYRNQIIIKAFSDLRKLDIHYDAIACCGVSGLMVVPQIAELLKKNIVIVRKNEERYSDFIVEGCSTNYYIIVDDLVCSGNTAKYIMSNIKEETPFSKCVGIYSYMPEECGYRTDSSYCKTELGIPYLNHL